MKSLLISLAVILVCSCSTHPSYTGQRYVEESPTFYLSIAPSFQAPSEYEVRNNTLFFREYSGFGGFDWGSRKVVAVSEIGREQQDKIRALTLKAIADTISIESERSRAGAVVVVADGTQWYIQSDTNQFFSLSTNNPESEAFSDLLILLNSILGRSTEALNEAF